MGLKTYFKPSPRPASRNPPIVSEKIPSHFADALETNILTAPAFPSSRASLAPSTNSSTYVDEIKHEVIVNYLYQQQCSNLWVHEASGELEGVLMRKSRNSYMACPPQLTKSAFGLACAALNVQAAMTVNSRVIKVFLGWSPDAVDVPLMNGLRVQILPTIEDLPRARKHQFAAFVASEALLVVWDDDALHLIERAKAIESEMMELVWKTGEPEDVEQGTSKVGPNVAAVEIDEESGEVLPQNRPTKLLNTVLVSFTIILIIVVLGSGCNSMVVEVAVDHNYLRFLFLLLAPIQIFFTLFFAQVIVGCFAQCFGPVRQMTQNSRFFSAHCSPRLQNRVLPHITIQCPVYKEGLHSVIVPTVRSIKQAISTYELQGGSANMFINDDGLQVISEEDRTQRIEFYADNCIGWTARPKHGANGFNRRGKFKKASNMNYGLMISCKIEEKLLSTQRSSGWTQSHEALAYEQCLNEVLQELEVAWADGNIRIGDYILLIDSDTRVPADCLLDAASEMEQSPEVGIMQFTSGVMQVVHTYFENGITFFTNLIYTAIKYTVSNGDVAPFVGHNAMLRWAAIQQVSYEDEDNYEKFWSESHVSEDFDMSLRLQCNGFIIRLAAWAGEGFKEGVSLTVYDELSRWEKYAYGCNELLFWPIRMWPYKGPFTPLFRKFLFSNIRFTSKVSIISYIGTYYAIGAAWILTTANYFAIGWFNGYLDKYYIDSWKVWFSIVIVFNGLGNVALAAMRYRDDQGGFFHNLMINFKWTLMLAIFLGGLSLHVSSALLAHMFEINMTWGATAKEAEFSNFFIEVPKVLRKFKFSMLFALIGIIGMIVLSEGSFVPPDWQIKDFVAILPMSTVTVSHMLLPIVLNPALMTFSWNQIYGIYGLRFPALWITILDLSFNLPIQEFTISEGSLNISKIVWTCLIMSSFRLAVLITTIVLTALLVTAGISYLNIQNLSLPISGVTAFAAVLIPILNGASIAGSQFHYSRVRRSNPRKTAGFISWPTVNALLALTIYETVIATLMLTHMVPPDDLTCGLRRQWDRLYSKKDATAIRRIQDAHQCCGLVTPKDHAWPFQDKNNKADACIMAFDRHKGCLLDWKQDEQIYAGLLLLVALSTIGLKILIVGIASLRHQSSWFHRLSGRKYSILTAAGVDRLESGTSNENGVSNGIPRRIERAYRDDISETADDEDSDPRGVERATVRNDNRGIEHRAPAVLPSALSNDRNQWRDE